MLCLVAFVGTHLGFDAHDSWAAVYHLATNRVATIETIGFDIKPQFGVFTTSLLKGVRMPKKGVSLLGMDIIHRLVLLYMSTLLSGTRDVVGLVHLRVH